jgi:hypothetical protein
VRARCREVIDAPDLTRNESSRSWPSACARRHADGGRLPRPDGTEIEELRTRLLEAEARFTVVKNTLTRLAPRRRHQGRPRADRRPADRVPQADGDPVAVAKVLSDTARAPRVVIRGGLIEAASSGTRSSSWRRYRRGRSPRSVRRGRRRAARDRCRPVRRAARPGQGARRPHQASCRSRSRRPRRLRKSKCRRLRRGGGTKRRATRRAVGRGRGSRAGGRARTGEASGDED